MDSAALTYSVRIKALIHFTAMLAIILGILNLVPIVFGLIVQEWEITGINALISLSLIGFGSLFCEAF